MYIFLIITVLLIILLFIGRDASKLKNWINPAIVTRKQFRPFLIISLLTLLFFSTSFGIIFYKDIQNPHPPHTDNGLGMAFIIFVPPVLLTIITTLISAVILVFVNPDSKINVGLYLITGILTIPAGLFGVLCFIATIAGIMKH